MTSLTFWLCLLFSAAIYATVALSPKLVNWIVLTQQHRANQLRLVAIENQVEHLKKIVSALKTEKSFAQELARVDFHAAGTEEQRIPVAPDLALNTRSDAANLNLPAPELPWYTPLLQTAAYNARFGDALLGLAAGLIIYAFTCLHENGPGLAPRPAQREPTAVRPAA